MFNPPVVRKPTGLAEACQGVVRDTFIGNPEGDALDRHDQDALRRMGYDPYTTSLACQANQDGYLGRVVDLLT